MWTGVWRQRVAAAVSVVVSASVLLAMPLPASADPVLPPGADRSAPKQSAGSAAGRSHRVDSTTTKANAVGPQTDPGKRQPVPGAVGPEQRFPDASVPAASTQPQPAAVHVGGDIPARTSTGVIPGMSREVTAERTPRSTVFTNPDGTKTRRLYQGDVFVPGERGSYVRVDPSLTRAGNRLVPVAAAPVSIGQRADDPSLARLDVGDGTSAGFRLDSAAPVTAQVGGEGARFVGARPGADVVLTPTADGFKELIVLKSADAPTSWSFPLSLSGLVPELDAVSGDVLLVDGRGTVRALIPAGFMYDSTVDPHSGEPATSHGVKYTLDGSAVRGWTLHIDVDGGWLRDPARVFPVMVDPTIRRNTESDDTYGSSRDWAGSNASNDDVLKVGTYDGVEKAASYLHFTGAMSALSNKYILGASLNLYNVWSYSCRPYGIGLYPVTQPWSGHDVTWFPGPGYDSGDLIAWRSFAYGYDSCSPDTWVSFTIPADRMTRWAHGVDPFYGFTLRSDTNSRDSWKKFASANYPNQTAVPFLDVNYADEGAGFEFPSASFDPPVTVGAAGRITVRVTNWGTSTWTPTNGYVLRHRVVNASGTVVQTGTWPVPHNVASHETADIPVTVGATPVGEYTLELDMLTPGGAAFQDVYGSSIAASDFEVANGPPTINGNFPANNGTVDTLTPTLWASYYDPDNYPAGARQFSFEVCTGTPAAPVGCQASGWTGLAGWQVPAGAMSWSKPSFWYVTVSDTQQSSARIGPINFTPVVAQPPITSHLASAPDGRDMPNVNPSVGNFARTFTDATVPTAGPALAVTRTYNSQDLRTTGAFGVGWTTPFDQRLTIEPSGDALVTMPAGGQVRFGRNPDGSYAPPPGINLTLAQTTVGTPDTWVLRDASGQRRVFDKDGLLTLLTDADGRAQTYRYQSIASVWRLTDVVDVTSGRGLHLTWTGGHVTAVATDPPAAGQSAPTWTYSYTGDQLVQACTPLSAQSCTGYTYTSSSHYRSVVMDGNPAAYWPLGETSGGSADNVVARSQGQYAAAYSAVTLGTAGALAGSSDKAITLTGTATSQVTLPDNLINTNAAFSTELWFKASTGQRGVLFAEQNGLPGGGTSHYTPTLYVGLDGKLRGRAPTQIGTGPVIGLANTCLDVENDGTADGTPVQIWDCNGSEAQRWTYGTDGTLRAFGKCLDVQFDGTANGTPVWLWECNDSEAQQWRVAGNTLVNPLSGKCLDIPSDDATSGNNLQIWDCNSDSNQHWHLTGGDSPITSTQQVDDGQWHHAVLTANVDTQTVYLDGVPLGTVYAAPIDHQDRTKALVGNGYTNGFIQAPAGGFPFTGSVDEVAVYRYALSPAQAATHHTARTATSRLSTVVEPGGFTANTVTYDPNTGRVATTTDRNGATWTLGAPAVGTDSRQVTVNSTARDAVTYTYDTTHSGRLTTRTDSFGARTWEYNAAGFVSKQTDENGNAVAFDTDARGNVIGRTTCRTASACNTEYFGYYLNAADPLDPRNDVQIWNADARSSGPTDTTYRTARTIDGAGRVTQITHPVPGGQTAAPVETFTYSTGAGYTKTTQARAFVPADSQVLALTGDNQYTTVTMPFPVTVYGRPQTAIRVSTNGYASFSDPADMWAGTDPYPVNRPLPSPVQPNNALYPMWDDLIVDASASVRTTTTGTAPNRRFVIEWRNVRRTISTDRVNVEIVLAENGEISFNYSGVDPGATDGTTATIGLENPGGATAIQHGHDQQVAQNGTAVVFTPTTAPGQAPVAGLLLAEAAPGHGTTQHSYNPAGDRVTTVDPAGLTTTVEYDNLGRPTAATRSATVAGSPVSYGTIRTTYNAASLPVTVTAPGITNLLTSVTHTAVTTYGYDDAGRRTTQTISDGTGGDPARVTSWGYDPAGRLTSTTTADGAVTGQHWDTAGDLVTVTQPNGLVLRYLYDDAHRPVQVTATGAGVDPMDPAATNLVLQSLAYDPAGRLASEADAMGRETAYTYYGDSLLATATRVRRDANGNITSTPLADLDYDKAGNRTRQTTAGGVSTTLTYDPGGYLQTKVLDPAGIARTETYRTNLDGTISRVTLTGTEAPGRTERVDYTYDASGRVLTEAVDNTGSTPATLTTQYTRDPRGLVTLVTDPSGVSTEIVYDAGDNEVRTISAAHTVWTAGVRTDSVRAATTVGRNTFGDVTQHRLPGGPTTTITVDAMGRPVTSSLPAYTPPGGNPLTATTTTTYNNEGLPATVTDPLNRVTTYTYDKYGRPITVTDPDPDGTGPQTSPVWSAAYDRLGNIVDVTDPTGAHTSLTRDDLGRPVTRTRSERIGSTTVYYTTTAAYDDAGNLTSLTSPRGKTSTAEYNKAGQPTKVTDPTGRFVSLRYDTAGRVVGAAAGQGTTYASPAMTATYDLAGRHTAQSVCTATSGGGCGTVLKTRTWSYDPAGRVTQSQSYAGRLTAYTYDGAGQQTQVSQRTSATPSETWINVQLGYDAAGRPSRMVDGNGNATDYTYNTWGLPESTIEPATPQYPAAADRTWTTAYDAAGQPVRQILPGGVSRNRTFDRLGRLTVETGSGAEAATVERRVAYDAAGRPTTVSGPGGDTTYAWNDRGLLTTVTGPDGTASYGYDGDDNLTTRTDTTGTATVTYDDAGRTATVTDPLLGRTETYTYDALGRTANLSLGSGAGSRAYTYDDHGRLATDAWKRPDGTNVSTIAYGYDNDDLLTSRTKTGYAAGGTSTYGYDGAGRLTSWTAPGAAAVTYGYDSASNRTTVTGPAGTRTTTFNARNQAVSATGAGTPDESRTWSPRGTLASSTTGGSTTTYAFDALERLTQVAKPGTTVSYQYDALDRVARRNGATIGYADLSNQPNRVPTTIGESKVFRSPDGTPLSEKTGSASGRVLLADTLHNDIIGAADPATGALAAGTAYDPHGTPTASTGTMPLGFQGGLTDPDTGQVNAHARWYEPPTGGFASRDTWTLYPDPAPQNNRYLYGNADPINNTDPGGHLCDPACVAAAAQAAARAAAARAAATAATAASASIAGTVALVAGAVVVGVVAGALIAPGRTGVAPCENTGAKCDIYYYSDTTTANETRDLQKRYEQTKKDARAAAASGKSGNGKPGTGGSGSRKPGGRGGGSGTYRPSMAPRPTLQPINLRPPTVDPTAGTGISNTSGDAAVEPTITQGDSAGVPAQGQLDDSDHSGGWTRSDGTRSASVWQDAGRSPSTGHTQLWVPFREGVDDEPQAWIPEDIWITRGDDLQNVEYTFVVMPGGSVRAMDHESLWNRGIWAGHTSLAREMPVVMAGNFKVEGGRIVWVNWYSGHYRPGMTDPRMPSDDVRFSLEAIARDALDRNGFDTSAARWTYLD